MTIQERVMEALETIGQKTVKLGDASRCGQMENLICGIKDDTVLSAIAGAILNRIPPTPEALHAFNAAVLEGTRVNLIDIYSGKAGAA